MEFWFAFLGVWRKRRPPAIDQEIEIENVGKKVKFLPVSTVIIKH